MITFECPHCGNEFRVEAALKGRHGWCRVCKGLIMVPGEEDDIPYSKLPVELQVQKLEKILRQAGLRFERDGRYIRRIKQRLDSKEAGDARIVELREKVATLRGRLEAAEESHKELRIEMDAQSVERGAKDERIAHLEVQLESLRGEQRALSEKLQAEENGRIAAEAQADRLREEMAGSGDDGAGAIVAELDAMKAERDKLREELAATSDKKDELARQLNALESECAALNEAAASRDAKQSASDERIVSLEAEKTSMAEALSKADGELTGLRKKSAEQSSELETMKKAIIHAKEEVDRLEKELSDATRDAEDTKALKEEIRAAEDARLALAEKLGRAEAKAEASDGACAAAEERLAEVQRKLENALDQALRKEEEYRAAIITPAKGDAAAEKSLPLAEAQRMIEDAHSARGEAERRAEVAERDLARALEDKETVATKLDERTAELAEHSKVQARLEESQDQVRSLTIELANLAKQVAELETDIRARDEEIMRLRRRAPVQDEAGAAWPDDDGRDEPLMPELMDEDSEYGDEEEDVLTDSLLRFIQPESQESSETS